MLLKGGSAPSAGGANITPEDSEGYVFLQGGAGLRGQVWMLCLNGVSDDAAATTGLPGTDTSIFSNAVKPNADSLLDANTVPHYFVLLLEGGADGDLVRCLIHGIAKGLVIDAAGSPILGDPLVPATSGNLDAVTLVTERQVGFMLQGLTTPTSATLADVYFNGLWSLGRGAHA